MAHVQNNKLQTVIGILLAPVLLLATMYTVKILFAAQSNLVFISFVSRIAVWIALGLLFLYAAKVERQPFLLWKDKKYVWWKIILFVAVIFVLSVIGVIVANNVLIHFGLKSGNAKSDLALRTLQSNIFLLVFTCITAGITEELLFRGYLIPRINIVLKNPVCAVIISALFFAAVHIGWGSWQEIITPFWIGLVYGFFYWKYRNLKLLMIFHFIWDLSTLLFFTHAK